jgi:SAM-dependent methyltransferase
MDNGTLNNPHGIEFPQDGAHRGYFYVMQGDLRDGSVPTGVWKNKDFLRLKDYTLHLLEPGPGKTILDIGCHVGSMMIYCGLQGSTVYGQDLDPGAVAETNAALRRFGIHGEAVVGDAASLRFPDSHFDAVLSNDFFEHITDELKAQVLSECLRVLKPGGILLVRTPNLAYLKMSLFYKRLRAVARLQNPFKLVIPHTPGTEYPEHIGLTDRGGLARCLTGAGFQNYEFFYPALRRFGASAVVEVLSSEVPFIRDFMCEDLVCRAYKPIALSHFPD